MPEATTHKGSCHCGAVRYRVELDLSKPVLQCNCSMCARSGTLLAFVPPEKFQLEQGEESVTDYQYGKKVIHFLFCKTCGIRPFSRGVGPDGPTVAINTRCLEGFDLAKMKIQNWDGKSR
jgi:hypothetical protein